jgi:DNA polymerase bacteriophage-type
MYDPPRHQGRFDVTKDGAHIDFETHSAVDLKKAGVYRYAEHPSTGVWCMSWGIDDGAKGRWRPGDEDPLELLAWIESGGRVVAHNAGFERIIWNWVIRKRICPHWPELRIEQQDCTMARGLALGLPADLERLGKVLRTPIQKDKDGHALMLRMCKPRRTDPDGTLVWWDDEDRIERLGSYCDVDRLTETLIDNSIAPLSDEERRLWELDQHINDRGITLDVASVDKALAVVTEALKRADDRMWWLTDGVVKKCSEVAKLVKWLNDRGIPCESIAKGEIDEIILKTALQGDDHAEEAIRLRRSSAKVSTSKFKAMIASVCSDNRLRGSLAYHGAATGRWAGRLWQPQNLLRIDPEHDLPDVYSTLEMLALPRSPKEIADAIELVVGPPLENLAKSMRAMLIAAPGKKLLCGDFSNIEGRGAAWIAGERWKLDAFAAYDRKEGVDLYTLSYSRSFGVPIEEITKATRQVGKVTELALGFQGSVGALLTMAANYSVDPAQMAVTAKTVIAGDEWHRVSQTYSDEKSRGLDQETWTGLKTVVDAWRAAHPHIVQAWWDLQDAAIAAVGSPGLKVPVLNDRVIYLAANGFLYCRLPSGRVISYAMPRLIRTETENGHERLSVEYEAIDSYTKRWMPHVLYGGMQFNNVVQGLARDKLVSAMFRIEEAGYPIVLTVHDEAVSEVDEGFGSWQEYREIMAKPDPWCADMPVSVGAWEDVRYVK